MIGVAVDHNGNTLLMSFPTDELYDHLGSIGITKATPNNTIKKQICSQKRIPVPYYLRKSALYQANKFFLSAR